MLRDENISESFFAMATGYVCVFPWAAVLNRLCFTCQGHCLLTSVCCLPVSLSPPCIWLSLDRPWLCPLGENNCLGHLFLHHFLDLRSTGFPPYPPLLSATRWTGICNGELELAQHQSVWAASGVILVVGFVNVPQESWVFMSKAGVQII